MTAFSVPANLAFDSYSELIAAINDWLDRSDLTGSAPGMIALCESRLRRELQSLALEGTASVSVVNGIGAIPADCDFIRSVFDQNNATLDEASPEIGRQRAPGQEPVSYSLEANQLRIWPAWSGTVTVLYQAKLTSLNDANSSNTILLEHPDVYFFGSMMFAEGYLANDGRLGLFKSLWDESIASLQRYYRRQRRDRVRLRNPVCVV